jgi:hypothetical protein
MLFGCWDVIGYYLILKNKRRCFRPFCIPGFENLFEPGLLEEKEFNNDE